MHYLFRNSLKLCLSLLVLLFCSHQALLYAGSSDKNSSGNSHHTAALNAEFFELGHPGENVSATISDKIGGDCKLISSKITAEQYCLFLNGVASTNDPYHLYDQRMEDDPNAACIVRSTSLGHYIYQLPSGTENRIVPYLTEDAIKRYCNWLYHGQAPFEKDPMATETGVYDLSNASNDSLEELSGDSFLASNIIGCCVSFITFSVSSDPIKSNDITSSAITRRALLLAKVERDALAGGKVFAFNLLPEVFEAGLYTAMHAGLFIPAYILFMGDRIKNALENKEDALANTLIFHSSMDVAIFSSDSFLCPGIASIIASGVSYGLRQAYLGWIVDGFGLVHDAIHAVVEPIKNSISAAYRYFYPSAALEETTTVAEECGVTAADLLEVAAFL